jgi:hypothetical protein
MEKASFARLLGANEALHNEMQMNEFYIKFYSKAARKFY